MRMNCINWRSISDACGLEDELTAALKKNLLPGLEAIARWIDKERTIDDDRPTPDDERRAPAARGISPYLRPENRHRLARSRCMTSIPNCDRAFLRLLSQSRQPTA